MWSGWIDESLHATTNVLGSSQRNVRQLLAAAKITALSWYESKLGVDNGMAAGPGLRAESRLHVIDHLSLHIKNHIRN